MTQVRSYLQDGAADVSARAISQFLEWVVFEVLGQFRRDAFKVAPESLGTVNGGLNVWQHILWPKVL